MITGPNAGRGRRVEAEPAREFAEHRMTPIPVPPFRDTADEKAALAAAVAVVASLVLGEWPHPDRLATAVAALHPSCEDCADSNVVCVDHLCPCGCGDPPLAREAQEALDAYRHRVVEHDRAYLRRKIGERP